MFRVSLWTTLLSFVSMLTVYSITFSQTKDCDNLSGYYVCVENRFFQQKINWCRDCSYGYVAHVYFVNPNFNSLNFHIGWFTNTEVRRSDVCGSDPNAEFPVWIGRVTLWLFYVYYDPYKRENKIESAPPHTSSWGCFFPSLSQEIVLLEGAFECPGGPNLERDAKYLREIKYGKGACDEDKCKCIDFPDVNQCDTDPRKLRCRDETYDNDKRGRTFCQLGCALSSLVSVMKHVGCNVDPCDVNRCNECFDDKGNVKWDIIIRKYCPDKLRFVERKDNCPRTIDEWRAYCSNDQFAILQMQILRVNPSRQEEYSRTGRSRTSYHFVVFRCVDEKGNILTMDPAYGGRYRPEDCRGMRIFSKK